MNKIQNALCLPAQIFSTAMMWCPLKCMKHTAGIVSHRCHFKNSCSHVLSQVSYVLLSIRSVCWHVPMWLFDRTNTIKCLSAHSLEREKDIRPKWIHWQITCRLRNGRLLSSRSKIKGALYRKKPIPVDESLTKTVACVPQVQVLKIWRKKKKHWSWEENEVNLYTICTQSITHL